jgi:aconitate hydratase
MGKTLTEKIIEAHLVEGVMDKGFDIAIKIDQTLTQDATGKSRTMIHSSY